MSILSAFPRRPLKLAYLPSARIGMWEVLGFLMFFGTLIADIYYIVPPLVDELLVGNSGAPAQQAKIGEGGKCRSRNFITDCGFDTTYRTADGVTRTKSLTYLAIGEGINDQLRFQVWYDPAHPDRIATSWGRDILINRAITEIAALAFLGAILGYFAFTYVANIRKRRSLLAMASAPRPVAAAFTRAAPSRNSATVHFTWTDPETGAARRDWTRMPGRTQPFWLDGERKTMLALAGPDGHAHALDERLGPAILTEEEMRALGQAMTGTATTAAMAPSNATVGG